MSHNVNKQGNSFKWYREGNNFEVDVNYTSAAAVKIQGTCKFKENGFVSNVDLSYADGEVVDKLNFTYSK